MVSFQCDFGTNSIKIHGFISYSIRKIIIAFFHQNTLILDLIPSKYSGLDLIPSKYKVFRYSITNTIFGPNSAKYSDFRSYSIRKTIWVLFHQSSCLKSPIKTNDSLKINVKLHPRSIKIHIRTSENSVFLVLAGQLKQSTLAGLPPSRCMNE